MSKKVILVVDDEQRIADTIALILRSSGYETAVEYEGESALAHCSRIQPDLLLTDVRPLRALVSVFRFAMAAIQVSATRYPFQVPFGSAVDLHSIFELAAGDTCRGHLSRPARFLCQIQERCPAVVRIVR